MEEENRDEDGAGEDEATGNLMKGGINLKQLSEWFSKTTRAADILQAVVVKARGPFELC